MKLFLILCAIVAATPGSAQNLAQNANTFCADYITETQRYLAGIGEISLAGKPMNPSVDWEVPYDTVAIHFVDRDVKLTVENTPIGALGDYIATTITHSKDGLIPFAVISDNADGNRMGIIQPFLVDDEPHCFASVVQKK